MAVEVSKFSTIIRVVEVNYFDEIKFNITYKPDAMTPQRERELKQLRQEQEEQTGEARGAADIAEEFATNLAEVLVAWDVVKDGKDFPPTKKNLMTFPNPLLIHISAAINDDMVPKSRRGAR